MIQNTDANCLPSLQRNNIIAYAHVDVKRLCLGYVFCEIKFMITHVKSLSNWFPKLV